MAQRPPTQYDPDTTMAARAAWLHFAGGKTQSQVAEELGIQNTKAHRLIARARSEGLVKVFVEGPIAGCIDLEAQLKEMFALNSCEVVPNVDDNAMPLNTLGMAGARYMCRLITEMQYKLVGIGHGRTLAKAADCLPAIPAMEVRFVSLLGGLTRRFAASPFDVIHRLAERTGAEAYIIPAPLFANSVKDREILESQLGIAEVLQLARKATLYFAGIGEVDFGSFLATGGMITSDDVDHVRKAGGVGELLGQFFRDDGTHLPGTISERALGPRLQDLQSHRIIAISGGPSKIKAIQAVLKSGLLYGLITDERTAHSLIDVNRSSQTSSGWNLA